MQLKKPKSIRSRLSKATCLLLGTPAAAISNVQASEFAASKWDFESAILYYSELNRVTAVEPVISAKQDLNNDKSFTVKLAMDVLSGASPSGAVPSSKPQTFASTSGGTGYSIAANELPLDPTFKDQRFAANLSWETPVTRQLKRISGLSFSAETDYLSLGATYTLTYDTNHKNTTWTAGLGVNSDRIAPIGGKHEGLVEVPTTVTNQGQGGGEDDEHEGGGEGLEAFLDGEKKLSSDILLGVTQVLSRKSLLQVNYGYGKTTGYMNDPYKMVTVVDPANSPTAGQPVAKDAANNLYPYIYENRPDSRTKQSVYWKLNHQFNEDVVYLSYRYYWDDWDIKSHTYDLRYRLQLSKHTYLQPHYRYYQQSAANFYRYFLVYSGAGQFTPPEYVSADYRLGEMSGSTVGLLYGAEFSKSSEFTFRVEYMKQSGEGHPKEAVGDLKQYDLFPEFSAMILQLNYSQKF